MSFVGTRPEVTKYVKKYTKEMRATLLLPAGMTFYFKYNYYINNEFSWLLVVLAVLLDMKVTNGMAGMIIQLTGLGKQGIAKLNEYLGERCIAREAALLKEIDKNVLDANHGECVNNDLECKFQEKGECRCTFTEVEKIIDIPIHL